MSEQYNINVQPELNTDALYEQLNNQKYKINVEVDGAALNSQLQSAVNSVTGGAAPAKVPVEFETGGLKNTLSTFNTFFAAGKNIGDLLKKTPLSPD
ncbi:hypothetical protein LAJLEIBI_02063 [[Clostridium] hylemonae DSM 15053]|uniref:hypothetical protein n=2 Tax=[Clostridium] hylemonae TaxID=89153 RepID=UPI00058B32B8|nr:hypothetical protein [[Clostridium] hylemonae]QEK18048.1 hypothetical protein LAJLEIBI_02063 [[Clostridium] hylemonae DSM 15053]